MSRLEEEWEEKLRLVQWENSFSRKTFDLSTIHSLLVDPLPKFQQLKQIVANYNLQTDPARIRYQQSYIEHLFKMLSQLTRLDTLEQQLQQLDKLHYWATKGAGASIGDNSFGSQNLGGKGRPGTASTRTRPTTAYSRPQTGFSRPGTAKTGKGRPESIQMKRDDPKIDYDKLKEGEQQFYSGTRTIHPELPPPKKRLKNYERVKLAEENEPESDLEIIQLEEKPACKQIQVSEEKLVEDIENQPIDGDGQLEGGQGQAGQGDLNEVNVDDIPIEGEEEAAGLGEPEEEVDIIDKLRPKVRAYCQPAGGKISKTHLQGGLSELQRYQYYKERKVEEDKDIAQLQSIWAQGKSRAKSQMKRRAESARITTQKIGIPMKKQILKPALQNVVSFQNIVPFEVAPKQTRPTTAFTSDRIQARQELIKNAFVNGKLSQHIAMPQFAEEIKRESRALTAIGVRPKKRCFEDILRDAEERVIREADEEVRGVKGSLAKTGVGVVTNRIAKSITFEERQLPGQWKGIVTGMGMIKNPFIKVAKKKKKKKKTK